MTFIEFRNTFINKDNICYIKIYFGYKIEIYFSGVELPLTFTCTREEYEVFLELL